MAPLLGKAGEWHPVAVGLLLLLLLVAAILLARAADRDAKARGIGKYAKRSGRDGGGGLAGDSDCGGSGCGGGGGDG